MRKITTALVLATLIAPVTCLANSVSVYDGIDSFFHDHKLTDKRGDRIPGNAYFADVRKYRAGYGFMEIEDFISISHNQNKYKKNNKHQRFEIAPGAYRHFFDGLGDRKHHHGSRHRWGWDDHHHIGGHFWHRWLEEYCRNEQTPAVPVPAAIWLFASGLIGLCGIAGLKQKRNIE